MADLAFVFGWGPSVMDPMPILELVEWHGLAIDRVKARNGTGD